MLSRLKIDNATSHHLSSVEQLRQQARFLRNHCRVSLGHAQEMVAYFFRCSSWGELINRRATEQEQLRLNEMREVLQAYRDKISSEEYLQLAELEAIPGTITEAIENNRIAKMNDLDVVQLYNLLFDAEYWGQPSPVSWFDVLDKSDRCLVLLAKRMAKSKRARRTINPHINFPWFGFQMYGYLHVEGKKLDYDCTELESYLYPEKHRYERLFKRPWFVAYCIGFVRFILSSLSQSDYHGTVSFSRFSNEGLIENFTHPNGKRERYSSNGHSFTDVSVNSLVEQMIAMGGQRDERRQRITFSFGNGEDYR
ncbi:hypothetical protein [Xenorhabdus sp. PB62.4]|uniref:hypothetical protein n=1 Tax=Xenorhabdus sp. PB62.4 TaxID=1851573 RepID=UPI001657110B|nr:hypothetical protein [Xenorhabdus sp. PB62.4]MBC8952492.1 hypothetical protein [Xenorhabdus sp. PB62.4]